MKESLIYDDPVINNVNENISDDMTDTPMKNLDENMEDGFSMIALVALEFVLLLPLQSMKVLLVIELM